MSRNECLPGELESDVALTLHPERVMNVSLLKNDINPGRSDDKAPAFDPAAAPLGTDKEAAGTPVPSAAVETARASVNRPEGCARARTAQ